MAESHSHHTASHHAPAHHPPSHHVPDIFDVTIVGGGPVGLFGSFYAGLRHMKTKIIDSLDQLGGQLATLYPEKYVYDVGGFPKVLAKDLASACIEQGLQYAPTVCLSETVDRLERDEVHGSYVITTNKHKHYTKTIILCAGAGAFSPKKLPVHVPDHLVDSSVYYSVKAKSAFAGKRVLIVGGGDSAIDWGLNLLDTAAEITVIHRRNQFRAHEDSVRKLLASRAQVLTFWELKALECADGKNVDQAVLVQNQTKEERTLPVDCILVQIGFSSSLGPLKHWPVKTVGHNIVVDPHMETNLPGVYAAGDVATYEGKLKLIATGFGEVAVAVNFAKTHVDPSAKVFPGHSSELSPDQVATTIDSTGHVQ